MTLDYDADIIGIGMNKDSVGLVEYDIVKQTKEQVKPIYGPDDPDVID